MRILCAPSPQSVMVRNQTISGWVTGKCRAWMLEKTPSRVCLPEPGSMWTPSQVIQVSSCGLECTGTGGRGAGGGANHFLARPILNPGMRSKFLHGLAFAVLLAGAARGSPRPIKVVVITTFEEDNDSHATGLSEGEGVRWIRGLHLDQVLPLPAGFHAVRLNDQGVLELMTGMATGRAAASVMALGLDPRFDLTHAYWILAGIAGVDPQRASLASAAWAEWVVDGDLDNFVDPREIPAG